MAGTLHITRENAFMLRVRKLRIEVDGEPLADIGNNQTLELPLPEGAHTLQVKVDLQKSALIDFSIEEGQTRKFTCTTAVVGDTFGEKAKNIFSYKKSRKESLQLSEC